MLIVCIESPFRPSDDDVRRYEGRYSRAELLRQNIVYARMALLNSLLRGEAPLASHLLYTQVWSEKPELRANGIKAGVETHQRVDQVALYIDLGISGGMKAARDNAKLINVELSTRAIMDLTAGQDARDVLAKKSLEPMFPYLEELLESERKSEGRIRAGTVA